MGSQLTKTPNRSTSTPSGSPHPSDQPLSSQYQSLRSSPLHKTSSKSSTSRLISIPKSIIVVNRGPEDLLASKSSLKLLPEPLIKPLVPFGQSSVVISNDQPRLTVQPFVEIGKLFDHNLRLAAETVSVEQQKIAEKIRFVEQQSQKIQQQFCQEKQKRFQKAVDNFGKLEDISQLLDRCETDIELLLNTFAKLNSALPESLRLENFQTIS